jgi:hypothetical protein
MSEPGDEPEDEITREYRAASAVDAGAPSAATRAAILANARAVATARRSPANEPRFDRRALTAMAAGVAVIGVAVVLWHETGRQPGTPAAQQARNEVRDAAKAVERAAEPPEPVADVRAEAAGRSVDSQNEVVASRSVAEAVTGDLALLRREFPAEFAAATPPEGVWLLQDTDGRTLRRGTLGDGENFGDVALRLRRELPERRIGDFQVREISTGRGATTRLAVARAQ